MEIKSDRKSSPRGLRAPLALVLLLTFILLPAPALAYLDPGTGSFVIQGIIAVVVGAGLYELLSGKGLLVSHREARWNWPRGRMPAGSSNPNSCPLSAIPMSGVLSS